MSALGELRLDREQFLARHWQREPLLIRNAIPAFTPPIDRHELAGLAMEEDPESRIIEYRQGLWHQQHGPFTEADFQRDVPWTLLVQAVDHYIPEVAALRDLVDFLPRWRVDDVMVSYAEDGGSVGPHFDNYDVFLLQGEGERRWQTGGHCDASSALLEHDQLRILADFKVEHEYLLGPGDILYLPPGIAHWGVAQGECTTFSIGFRAPRLYDMVSRWTDHLLEQLDSELFYSDTRIEPTTRPGEIRPRDLERARAQLQAALDQARGDDWFGELVTEPRYQPLLDEDDLAEARAQLEEGIGSAMLSPAAKLAWRQRENGIVVYANGEGTEFPIGVLPLLMELCDKSRLSPEILGPAVERNETRALMDYLLETGCLYVE